MNSSNLLQNLRDIHLPAPISFWPHAVGWYAVYFVLAILVIFITRYFFILWMKHMRVQTALKKLTLIINNDAYDTHTRFAQLSSLIRRVALAKYQREDVAGLQGEAWLRFLDHTGNTQAFTQGDGRSLITAPYNKTDEHDIHAIHKLLEHWVKAVLA